MFVFSVQLFLCFMLFFVHVYMCAYFVQGMYTLRANIKKRAEAQIKVVRWGEDTRVVWGLSWSYANNLSNLSRLHLYLISLHHNNIKCKMKCASVFTLCTITYMVIINICVYKLNILQFGCWCYELTTSAKQCMLY